MGGKSRCIMPSILLFQYYGEIDGLHHFLGSMSKKLSFLTLGRSMFYALLPSQPVYGFVSLALVDIKPSLSPSGSRPLVGFSFFSHAHSHIMTIM